MEQSQPKSNATPDVLRRADLFCMIADLVYSESKDAKIHKDDALPRLVVLDRRLFVGGRSYDLSRRPLMLKLFQTFVDGRDGWLSRDELLRKVYGVTRIDERSKRYLDSAMSNAIKLVSRARCLTTSFFLESAGSDYEWLAYDPGRKSWRLVRARATGERMARVVNGS